MLTELFQQARIEKDGNFDGQFFFGVVTTGIFCRPSCPSPTAKEENVRYFKSLFKALDNGYRPCLRCRPDIHSDYYGRTNTDAVFIVETALNLIYQGYLNNHSLADLAEELLVSDRHLRKLFHDIFGIPPVTIAKYHKALFAKKMLLYSSHSVTDIAFSAGFGSLRQFNDVFKDVFGMTPTLVRKECGKKKGISGKTRLLLTYHKPFSFEEILDFLRPRAIKGVELITDKIYSRTFRLAGAAGFFSVSDIPELSALELLVDCDDITCYMELYAKVRKMFDLDTNFIRINMQLANDERLLRGMTNGHVPRLSVAFSPFEFVIRAILGQQISIAAATTLASRIVQQGNCRTVDGREGLDYFFPEPEEILLLNLDGLGITSTRQQTIKNATKAILDGKVKLSAYQTLETFSNAFSAIPGIGPWTVNYVAMRGLGMLDAFPSSDLGIIKALSTDTKITPSAINAAAREWRPYRSYAALCLWNSLHSEDAT